MLPASQGWWRQWLNITKKISKNQRLKLMTCFIQQLSPHKWALQQEEKTLKNHEHKQSYRMQNCIGVIRKRNIRIEFHQTLLWYAFIGSIIPWEFNHRKGASKWSLLLVSLGKYKPTVFMIPVCKHSFSGGLLLSTLTTDSRNDHILHGLIVVLVLKKSQICNMKN